MKGLMMSLAGLVLILCRVHPGVSQGMVTIKPKHPIICYQSFDNRHDHVAVSQRFNQLRQQVSGRVKTAAIEVEYINFPQDNLAKTAFQVAVDIWESELVSTVPIRVRAEWRPLSPGVLGQALWGSAHANFGGEQHMNVFYPVALAEKITGRDINDPAEADILASFNSNASWYFGTDGNTPSGKMDMVTIVLHEIAHGLGFTDTYDVSGTEGSVGLPSEGTTVPFIFDIFVENKLDKNLLQEFQSPSQALATELQSANLFFNSPLSTSSLNGTRPKLYAPTTFDNGSSISHLDEGTFNTDQDANRLMTPQISFAESIHDPGSVLRATLADMGWVHTLIQHEPLKDTERKNGQPYLVKARIRSDNGYDPTSVKLHYTSNGVNFQSVNMLATGVADEFESSIPGTGFDMVYAYYISVDDVEDRVFTSPGMIHEVGAASHQGLHYFRIGPDVEAPQILHNPIRFVSEDDDLIIKAQVTDNQGIKEVTVEYKVNESDVFTVEMEKSAANQYMVSIDLPALSPDDVIRYRLVARDAAALENMAIDPVADFYIVDVTGVLPVRDSYVNNFNKPSTDFFGDSFGILTPQGFKNGAIHTNHPYENGSGPNGKSITYQLQVPIRIDAENPVIMFEELVLVEPGENGSVFGGDDFYDYVVVEGSADRGASWEPFAAGYDSRANNGWLTRYQSDMSGDNSQARGDSTMFRERTIDMLQNGKFTAGDEVMIRFRLFADEFAHGWGWAIDNLEIQPTILGIEAPLSAILDVYPVPSKGDLFVDLFEPAHVPLVIEIADAIGRVRYANTISEGSGSLHLLIDIHDLEEGMYILRATTKKGVYTRKFLRTGNR